MSDQASYYKTVSTYYDHDAVHFEKRYHHNPLLQQIRESFRQICNDIPCTKALEIGYGPGLDLVWCAQLHPNAKVNGIDISQGMYEAAVENAKAANLSNIHPAVGSVEDIAQLFPGEQYDLIYVFFGALNTVEDLGVAAKNIDALLKPGGKAVLTFVNKWYLRGFLVPFIKGRFKIAFARFNTIWGGYSTRHYLPSKCYSLGQIKKSFDMLQIDRIKGYSILFPPWYDASKWQNKRVLERLWAIDEKIGEGFAKGWGEYSLFVFSKPK